MQLKLGFRYKWVTLIMNSVTSVQYTVKVNNDFSGSFLPHRGLRHRDPLSPYLFLLCVEWLSRKLHSYVVSKNLTGIRICRGAPMISHLLFADDSIFFLEEKDQNIVYIQQSLGEYQLISS